MRPNVLLIICDTARADAFEPYGAAPGSTPGVAALAERGLAVQGVHSTAGWTLPAHASLFTGLLPRALGLTPDGPGLRLDQLTDRVLAEVLRRSGYATAGISANPMLGAGRFGIGFDEYRVIRGGRRHAPGKRVRDRVRWARDAVLARIDDGLAEIDATVHRWFDEAGSPARAGQPWFWFVNLMECHSPYLPPQPWNDLGPWARFRAGEEAARHLSHAGIVRYCLGESEVPARALDRMRHLYGCAVRSMDDWIARTVHELDRRGMLDDTLVIVTSDHGENLGEGHLLAHSLSIDDRLLRVPFVLAGPGAAPLAGGDVSSLTGVPRLIADACDLSTAPWHDDPIIDGVAIAQNDGLRVFGTPVDLSRTTDWDMPEAFVEAMAISFTAASDGRFKLVRAGDDERLHDLQRDPLEQVDVLATHPEVAQRLREVLAAAEAPAGAGTPAAPPTAPSAASDPDEDADLEERMRMLGYL